VTNSLRVGSVLNKSLYYHGARYYDPSAGRFLSEDPIGFKGGDTNFYRYVENNPVKHTDPKGESIGVIVKGVAIVAAGIGLGATANQCTQSKPEEPKDNREDDKKACQENKLRQLEECSQGQHSEEICASIQSNQCY
jgi:RHS repeat-associated protein